MQPLAQYPDPFSRLSVIPWTGDFGKGSWPIDNEIRSRSSFPFLPSVSVRQRGFRKVSMNIKFPFCDWQEAGRRKILSGSSPVRACADP
jgi:hypothetical protein